MKFHHEKKKQKTKNKKQNKTKTIPKNPILKTPF